MVEIIPYRRTHHWMLVFATLTGLIGLGACGQDDGPEASPPAKLSSGAPSEQGLIVSRGGEKPVKTIGQAGAVLMFHGDAEAPSSLCSGTLIAPDAVLTAAHCLINQDGSPLDLEIWRLQFTQGDKISTTCTCGYTAINEVVVHPAYTMRDQRTRDLFGQQSQQTQAKVKDAANAIIARCGDPDVYGLFARLLWYIGRPTQSMLAQEEQWADCAKDSKLLHVIERSLRESNHDIAVVFLKHPIYDVAPARLPLSDDGAMINSHPVLTASAYGSYVQRGQGAPMAGKHLAGQLAILEAHPLELVFEGLGTVVAPGDSGGGLFNDHVSPPEVVGVLKMSSTLQRSGRYYNPGFATHVRAYVPWIMDVMAAHDTGSVF